MRLWLKVWLTAMGVFALFLMPHHSALAQYHLSTPESELPTMEKLCNGGNTAGCEFLVRYYDSIAKAGGDRGVSVADAFKQKIDWAEKSCVAGGSYGCDAAGWAYEHGQESRARDVQKAFTFYQKGCDVRSGLSCNNLALAHRHGRGTPRNDFAARENFAKACQYGWSGACADTNAPAPPPSESPKLPQGERATPLTEADRASALASLETRCIAGTAAACRLVAESYETGAVVSPNLQTADQFYNRGCAELREPASCYLHSIFLTTHRPGDDWAARVEQIHDRLCAGRDVWACTSRAKKPPLAFALQINNMYNQGCEDGILRVCQKNFERNATTSLFFAGKAAERGCDLGDTDLCHNGGALYVKTRYDGGFAAGKAQRLFRKGCEAGEQASCDAIPHAALRYARERDAAAPQSKGGLGQFLSDLGSGINQLNFSEAYQNSPTLDAQREISRSAAQSLSASARQDRRDFDNAIRAINNIGTGFNSNCPSSNPYC